MAATTLTFFDYLTPLVRSGKKTITIRDETENNYRIGSQVEVRSLETAQKICKVKIESIVPIEFDGINEFHAQQEAMPLQELKTLIKSIYPNTNSLFVIKYTLVP